MKLIALQIKTTANFQENLDELKSLIISCEKDSIILAPELALSGFSYNRMDEASTFSITALVASSSAGFTINMTSYLFIQNHLLFRTNAPIDT